MSTYVVTIPIGAERILLRAATLRNCTIHEYLHRIILRRVTKLQRLEAGWPDACPQGHPYTLENARVTTSRGALVCLTCKRLAQRARYQAAHPDYQANLKRRRYPEP